MGNELSFSLILTFSQRERAEGEGSPKVCQRHLLITSVIKTHAASGGILNPYIK